jgi:dTDP-4-amino-4,6-dideoxygalactose transaminase
MEEIRSYLGVRHALYLSSGRAALWLALKALSSINPVRKEVVLPAYTCPAIVSGVLKAGLKPVLCDNNLNDFGFSEEDLHRKISENTLAVVVVHLFGYPANVERVKECCKKQGSYLIEDAAQAFGNSSFDSKNGMLGSQGDAGFLSFGRGKPISLLQGGVLTTNSDEIFFESQKFYDDLNHQKKFEELRYCLLIASYSLFSNPYLYWVPQRIPSLHLGETIFEPDFETSKGSELAASLLTELMRAFEEEKQVRRGVSLWYAEKFEGIPKFRKPPKPDFPYLRYPLFIEEKNLRDRMLTELMACGTGATLFYPFPLNRLPGLEKKLQDSSVYPNAQNLSETLIALPVHSGVSASHRQKILDIVKQEM